jgi:hypothetical protein
VHCGAGPFAVAKGVRWELDIVMSIDIGNNRHNHGNHNAIPCPLRPRKRIRVSNLVRYI